MYNQMTGITVHFVTLPCEDVAFAWILVVSLKYSFAC